MVLVEEIVEEVVAAPTKAKAESDAKPAESDAKPAQSGIKKGFLNDDKAEGLYPPEGSPEGVVAPETHKAHQEHECNKKVDGMMNRGAPDADVPKPEWYNTDWPKGCQYNAPGCHLGDFDKSGHQTPLHRDMVRNSDRWNKIFDPEATELRLSFLQMTDEDLDVVIEQLKKNKNIKELDLSYNKIKDQGVQTLVGALANGTAPELAELRMYKNEFGNLGEVMLNQGLPVFRKKLKVWVQEPTYGLKPTEKAEPAPEVATPNTDPNDMD